MKLFSRFRKGKAARRSGQRKVRVQIWPSIEKRDDAKRPPIDVVIGPTRFGRRK